MVKFKVSIPRKIEEQLDLASQVAARHALDGASSILNSLQDYTWNSLASTIPTCLAMHIQAATLEHRIKVVYPERTRLLTPIDKAVRATSKFLLGVFRAMPTRLGDWGFDVVMAGGRPRVTIPRNVKELLALARLIAQKHAADGATSVLNNLQDYSWTTLAPTIQPCFDKNQEAEQLDSDREQAYQTRNQLLPPIVNALRASRDLLMGAFAANLTRLGDWGFTVTQITRKPKPKSPPA
jgi:hypothetical protein